VIQELKHTLKCWKLLEGIQTKMKTPCEGCNIEKRFLTGVLSAGGGCTYTVPCYFKTTSKVDLCPCVECLVKAMCQLPCHLRREKLYEVDIILTADRITR